MFDPRYPMNGQGGCGCGQVVEVYVPGMQGPPGVKTAITYDRQELTDEQKAQARKNIGAVTAEEILAQITAQGFSLRFVNEVLEPNSKSNLFSILNPSSNVREGDSVIDSGRNLYQISSINKEAATFAVTGILVKLGVSDYSELEGAPKLGKLASLDEVSETELKSTINLGSIA